MRAALLSLLTSLSLLAGCSHKPPPPVLQPQPHYVVGGGYELGGVWYYPDEDFAFDATGLASVQPAGRSGLTANGEAIDDTALTASMQTLQLPSVVSVTNLESGLQLRVRVNDRGPANPGRLIALSPRAASLLRIAPDGAARVHVRIDAAASRDLLDALGGGPRLDIATAPTTSVTAEDLPAPGQAPAGANRRVIGAAQAASPTARDPGRLPEILYRVPAARHALSRCRAFRPGALRGGAGGKARRTRGGCGVLARGT